MRTTNITAVLVLGAAALLGTTAGTAETGAAVTQAPKAPHASAFPVI